MSDTILDYPERLNYFKLLIVVTEIAVFLTRKIMEKHLKKIGKNLQTFIDENRHEIFHCFDKRKCCLCQSNFFLASEKILKESQMRLLFDDSQPRQNGHRSENNNKWCCREVNPIDIDDLDLSFFRFFLFNFCDESLWDIDLTECQNSFNEILNNNKHDIYHLLHLNITCCACEMGYKKPKPFVTLDSKDFEKMFMLSKRKKCHNFCMCVYDAKHSLSHTELKKRCNKNTFIQLTKSFCNIRQNIEKVVKVRNDIAHVYGIHAEVSEDKFEKDWKILLTCTQAMGKVTGREEWTNEQMDRVKSCNFNDNLYHQMHIKLLQEAETSEETNHRLDRNFEVLQSIDNNVKLLIERTPNNIHNDKNIHKRRRTIESDLCPSPCIDNLEDGNWENNPGILPSAIKYIWKESGYKLDLDRVQSAELVIKMKPLCTENETTDHKDLLSGTLRHTDDIDHASDDEMQSSESALRQTDDIDHASDDDMQSSESDYEEDLHTCGCRKAFNSLDAFLCHKLNCQHSLKTKQKDTKNKTGVKKGTKKTESTEQVKITITPDRINPRFEHWTVDQKQKLQNNPELPDTEDMQTDLAEDGSLVVWAKMKSSVLKEKEKFETTVEKYVKNMFHIHPFRTDQDTQLNIKIDVINGMEGYEEDEMDTFKCGRCKETFHMIDSFCSHKRECNRKSHQQKIRKRKQLLDSSIQLDAKQIQNQEIMKSNSDDNPKDEATVIGEDGIRSEHFTENEITKNDVELEINTQLSEQKENNERHDIQHLTDSGNLQTGDDYFKESPSQCIELKPLKLGLPLYHDEVAEYESKLERKDDLAGNVLRKVRKTKSRTKHTKIQSSSQNRKEMTVQLQQDQDSEESEEENQTVDIESNSCEDCQRSTPCEDFFEESKKKKISDLAEDSNFITYGLDLNPEFAKDFVTNHVSRKGKKKSYYESFIENKEDLKELCKSDPLKYKRGILDIEASHKAKCLLTNCFEDDTVISISGRSNCGKAYSDDEVVVEIIGTEKRRKEKIQMKRLHSQVHRYGKVIGILKQNRCANMKNPVFICEIDEHEMDKTKPLCKTVPKFHLIRDGEKTQYTVTVFRYNKTTRELESPKQQKINKHLIKSYLFYVVCLSWELQYPVGAIFKIHESTLNLENCMKMLKLQHKLPVLYGTPTVRSVESMSKLISDRMRANRFDLTNLNVFTIDPENASVLDDAISIQHLENGEHIVGIHITDVASFVERGSPLDNEAFVRGTTYFPGQFLNPHHMLPEPISKMVCSLLPNEERLTLTVFLHFDKQKQIVLDKTQYCKSIVRSRYSFSYKEVQNIINNIDKEHSLHDDILSLYDIAKQSRRKRLGPARFAIPVELNMPGEKDTDCLEAYNLIEQFMILTNYVVGIRLVQGFPQCIPLRCQDPPPVECVAEWLQTYPHMCDLIVDLQGQYVSKIRRLSILNIETKLRPNDIVSIQNWVWKIIINACKNNKFKEARNLVCSDELHPLQALAINEWESIQQNAVYRCSGCISGTEGLHFSLGLSPYVHFTAPIRRYMDIVVQRLLHAAIDNMTSPYEKTEIERICQHVTSVSKNANIYRKRCKELILANVISQFPLLVNGLVENFSEIEINLIFPGIKFLPSQNCALPLHTLLIATAPKTKEDIDKIRSKTEKSYLVLEWKKRIYSATQRRPKQKHPKGNYQRSNDEFQKIDPHQKSVYQQTTTWIRLMKLLVSGATAEQIKKALNSCDLRKYVPSTFNTEMDINSELNKSNDVENTTSHTMFQEQFCKFSHAFSHGQVLELQLSAEIQNGFMSTNIDFLNLTNNIKFCIKHMRDPVGCFEQFSTVTPKKDYQCSQDYKVTWIPILLMESATSVVRESGITINDIAINFERTNGFFFLTSSFCFERNIDIHVMTSSFLEKHIEKASKTDSGVSDYICIRCLVPYGKEHPTLGNNINSTHYYWISHANITRVSTIDKGRPAELLRVQFSLTNGEVVPDTLKDKKRVVCSIEILQKTENEKRIEVCLNYLNRADKLAKAIALNKDLPLCDATYASKMKGDILDIKLPPNNARQSQAIQSALNASFCLIHGPPGTGKTNTGTKLIHLFHQINKIRQQEQGGDCSKIIVCGPSNKSVDLVARRLLKHTNSEGPDIVRFYGSSVEQTAFNIPGRLFSEQRGMDYKPDIDMNAISVHQLIRKNEQYANDILRFEETFKTNPAGIDSESMLRYRAVIKEATIDEIKKHDVILCTTSMATSPRLLEAIVNNVHQLIIDECGMCTEPECLSSIIAVRPKQVILIGDHMQLRPIVMCKQAADLGLEKSLFQRYSMGTAKFVQLQEQYRMHSSICRFPSERFYDGTLITAKSSSYEENPRLSIWINEQGMHREERHIFCHVEGNEEASQVSTEDQNEHSFSNIEEVNQVVKIVQHLHNEDKIFANENSKPTVNVMSQYNAQCNAVTAALKKEKLEKYVDVHTVVSSQGGEWDYVIFSLVRSLPDYRIEPHPTKGWCKENLGFITDRNQINVALTRAKKGLFLIGNQNLLRCDDVWSELIESYRVRNCIINCTNVSFPNPKHKRERQNNVPGMAQSGDTRQPYMKGGFKGKGRKTRK